MSTHTFVLSDESLNSYGFWVKTEGIDLSNFKKNPIMLYDHERWEMPIGRWTNIRVEDGKLLADADFDMKDEKAKQIAGKVADGYLNACSIGFKVLELSEEDIKPNQRLATVTRAKLTEVSITPIPSNENALKLHFPDGICLSGDMDPMSLENQLPLIKPTMKKVFEHLQLNQDASESEVLNAIKALSASQDQATQVQMVLSLGKAKGIVTDKNKELYQSLAEKDVNSIYELFEKQESTLQVPELISLLKEDKQEGEDNRDNWTLSDWKEKDYAGLLELKEKDKEKYNQLFQ